MDSVVLSNPAQADEDRIAALRVGFEAGTYQVDADGLAKRLIDEHTSAPPDESAPGVQRG